MPLVHENMKIMKTMSKYTSWGNYPHLTPQAIKMNWRNESFPQTSEYFLPYGNGRSYGDSCLINEGTLIDMRPLANLINFDAQQGILTCEAGLLLSDILKFVVPKGWFLPVTPGTRYITVGGAIANDIHGKNHHVKGNFGHHVLKLELLRSDDSRLICSPEENSDWFEATVGGLGLTGIITWAAIKMIPITNSYMDVETVRYSSLKEFFDLSQDSDGHYDYTVAWVDCLARAQNLGRGIFMRGNHNLTPLKKPSKHSEKTYNFPITPPFSLVNKWSLKLFNNFYYQKPLRRLAKRHYAGFFYPLDAINNWNRLYGTKGFFQYQCVVPMPDSFEVVKVMLEQIAKSKMGSFLAVLKVFGDKKPVGWLSFPREGATLALDFPYNTKSLELFDGLDSIVAEAGGALYPAKDARMGSKIFKSAFPKWQQLEEYRDPKIISAFWQRMLSED